MPRFSEALAAPLPARGLRVPAIVLRRPLDTAAGVLAGVVAIAIAVNALALQSGPHPAPLFSAKSKPVAIAKPPEKAAEPVPLPVPRREAARDVATTAALAAPPAQKISAAPAPAPVQKVNAVAAPAPVQKATAAPQSAAPVPPQPVPVARPAAPSRRVLAVQRALAEYGYGQIKPTGLMGPETQAAVEKFERDRKLPVTGAVSERVVKELASVTGRSFE